MKDESAEVHETMRFLISQAFLRADLVRSSAGKELLVRFVAYSNRVFGIIGGIWLSWQRLVLCLFAWN